MGNKKIQNKKNILIYLYYEAGWCNSKNRCSERNCAKWKNTPKVKEEVKETLGIAVTKYKDNNKNVSFTAVILTENVMLFTLRNNVFVCVHKHTHKHTHIHVLMLASTPTNTWLNFQSQNNSSTTCHASRKSVLYMRYFMVESALIKYTEVGQIT